MAEQLDPSVDAQWARVRARLREEYGESAFKSWLKPLTLVLVDEGEVRIAVPTRFSFRRAVKRRARPRPAE